MRTPVRKPALPMLNTSLILDLIQWAEISEGKANLLAEKFPHWGRWDQSNWASLTNEKKKDLDVSKLPRIPLEAEGGVCNTSYCMAGQAVVQSDYRLVYGSRIVEGRETIYADQAMPQRPSGKVSKRGWAIWEDVPGAEPVSVEFAGEQVLGLTGAEADLFFGGDNGLDDLKMMANRFANARGLPFLFPDETMYEDDCDADEILDYDDYAEPVPTEAFTAPAHIASQASVPTPV